jgi:quercetin dioxygenase-like cupin family protein
MKVKITRWPGSEPPSRSELERRLAEEGFSPWSWSDAAGTRYGDHTHPHTEVRWIYKGKIRIGTGGEVFELGPGDRLDMPPDTVHWAEVPESGPVSYLCGEKD